MDIGNFSGLRIVTSPLARQWHTEYRVERCVVRKRRRGYMVRKHEWSTPGCYQLTDGTLVIHPELAARLKVA